MFFKYVNYCVFIVITHLLVNMMYYFSSLKLWRLNGNDFKFLIDNFKLSLHIFCGFVKFLLLFPVRI